MAEDTNVFKFDLSEYLSFQKGQEVMELIGIALEPDISVYESEDYVTIRGIIELTGEYIPNDDSSNDAHQDDQILNLQDHHLKNYIQDIRKFEDGLNEFRYHIPVEVTVPKYRVPSLDEIMVEIDYFDYEIPDPSQLKLQAEVLITGIESDRSVEQSTDSNEKNEWEKVNQPFSFDVKFENEDESSSYFAESSIEEEIYPSNISTTDSLKANDEDPGRVWFKEKTETFDEFFGHHKEEDVVDDEKFESSSSSSSSFYEEHFEEVVEENRPTEEKNIQMEEEEQWEAKDVEAFEEDNHDEVEENSNKKLEARNEPEYKIEANDKEMDEDETREDVFYLFNMFNEGEQAFSRIRMCIVQEEDSLDMIAERYELSPTQIMGYNNIERDELQPGDILYIPRKTNKNPS